MHRFSRRLFGFFIALFFVPGVIGSARAAADITSIGYLPGGAFTTGTSIARDGSTLVGAGFGANGLEAFYWTSAGGIIGLGDLPGGTFSSIAYNVNRDGSVIVGYSESGGGTEAFRWTQATGMVGLGFLGTGTFSAAQDVSADGSVIIGVSQTGAVGVTEAFRWTQGTGMVGLGFLPGGGSSSIANATNEDGSVIVGYASPSGGGLQAFRWTQATGMVSMGSLPGAAAGTNSIASNINRDGSVIIGGGTNVNGNTEAFRWTQATGMVGLGFLPSATYSYALGINGDGSIITGNAQDASSVPFAFYWTQSDGMQKLTDILQTKGVDLTGWVLSTSSGISDDGAVIIGDGTYNGNGTTYIANLGTGGLTTPEALSESLQSVAQTDRQIAGLAVNAVNQSLFAAQNMQAPAPFFAPRDPTRIEPAAGGAPLSTAPFSLFTVGAINTTRTGNRNALGGNGLVGINSDVTETLRIGVGVIGGTSDNELRFDGESRVRSFGGIALAALRPDDPGLRVYASGFYSDMSIDATRGYLNGGGTDFSHGETDGTAFGGALKLGWAVAVDTALRVMPYLEGHYSKTRVDGYTEQGGAFPATFSKRDNDYAATLLGLDLHYRLNDRVALTARPALGRRLSDDGNGFTATSAGLAQPILGDTGTRNWAELSVGTQWQATERLSFSGEMTGRTGDTGQPNASVMIGAFLRF